MDYKRHIGRHVIRHLLGAPFVYLMIVPLVILDVCAEVYHRICFPLYGIACLRRSSYIQIDRQRLSYLGAWDKINCMYCGYANGLLHYVSVIAAKTEQYWCGIKHKSNQGFIPPAHHEHFLEYGDEKQYRDFIDK
ncbi:hypothetical protein HY732_03215 [Candidatus Uhrbacteria bacterium]|nr:hypothetical protein [Candidatus Uhrbacteria bacterium]